MCARDLDWFWFTSNRLKKWLKFLANLLGKKWNTTLNANTFDIQLNENHSIHLTLIESNWAQKTCTLGIMLVQSATFHKERYNYKIDDTMSIACSISKYTAQVSAT